MIEKPGTFCISLDFELIWGVFDEIQLEDHLNYFRQTRIAFPEILRLFEEFDVHATWATVGMLFNESWEEWENNVPDYTPNYFRAKLSSFKFGAEISKDKSLNYLFFAPDLILKIKEIAGQEIGSHTYSHFYCAEKGSDVKSFSADLAMAIKLARKFDVSLKSLVFPRNQILPEYLKTCYNSGITSVRSNPKEWFWKDPSSKSQITKIFRTGDAYIPAPGSRSYPYSDLIPGESLPLEQRASRFLRPFEANSILHYLKIRRILSEMTEAAKEKKVYHLWWHPHNFGHSPAESLNDLRVILKHFEKLRNDYGFRSFTMSEIHEELLNKA